MQAILLAMVLRTFLFQPFSIPSGSMKPTLLVGDYIFVSKYSYGYSKYSFPFRLPFLSGRIWERIPERGDVVVFKFPVDTNKDYIKRLIGLPGDKIQMIDSVIHINGIPVRRVENGIFFDKTRFYQPIIPEFEESMPNGRSYKTIDLFPGDVSDTTGIFEVPEGHYFFLGDNRDNSSDSRYDVGMVPAELLVGKAQVIFLSLDNDVAAWKLWRWPKDMRWNRIFTFL
ncbi:signal peptidase I [Candidatus Endowatersipora endosymbiont of Watersipora subatra]|uniref:signal peptidase I n=1 Tax=Candidatus Endowatersipora endosymbiont of Watersipora subatra TaxID=3077946 RepID=UPI00312C7296